MISFKDLPDKTTPINATNLNANFTELSDNISIIVESSSNSTGNWIKFADGTMISYQEVSITIPCNTEWGTLFVGSYDDAINFPISFLEVPKVWIDLKITSGALLKLEWNTPVITKSTYKNIGIARGKSSFQSNVTFTATILVIGKWK